MEAGLSDEPCEADLRRSFDHAECSTSCLPHPIGRYLLFFSGRSQAYTAIGKMILEAASSRPGFRRR